MVEEDSPSAADNQDFSYNHPLIVTLGILGSLSVCALVMRPFLDIIAWAFAFAVTLRPISMWIKGRILNQSFASCLVVFVGLLVIAIPASWVLRVLLAASIENLGSIIRLSSSPTWLDPASAPPRLASLLIWLDQTVHFRALMENFLRIMEQRLPNIVTLTLLTILKFALILFTAFFFIRDEAAFLRYLTWLSPLPAKETAILVSRVVDTTHACLFGIVLMAILQGTLGAFIFWWLELPRPALWGVVMGFLAIVPYLGAFIVWIPTSAVLTMHGAWTDAVILILWGAIVIGLADNLLYPILVGKRLHYHSLLIFFFLLGGVILFGAAGVVLGPVVMSVTHSLLELWKGSDGRGKTSNQRGFASLC